MVFEKGLDISSLPETLKKDFNQLDRLEGQYRVISILLEAFDLEDLSLRKGSQCRVCDVKGHAKGIREFAEEVKPMIIISKVILSDVDIVAVTYRNLRFFPYFFS